MVLKNLLSAVKKNDLAKKQQILIQKDNSSAHSAANAKAIAQEALHKHSL